jgi:general L-amino acid transport system substrate-binding protein
MNKLRITILSVICSLAMVPSAFAGTLDTVKDQGFFNCGVSQGVPGFSNPDSNGNWSGIDVDVCRAVSAAIFGNPDKVKYVPLTAKERFTALQSGEIDVLSRNTTWTLSRDAQIGLEFAGVNFYDGQGFMVRKDSGITSAMELGGASVCTNLGTTTELNMADFFRANGMDYEPVVFEKADEVVNAYDEGRCDTYTTDKSGLAAQRTKLADPDAHVVLPETISKEPLGPVVREGDGDWADVVRWSLNAMIEAEEFGLTQSNAQTTCAMTSNPVVARLCGKEGATGAGLNLGESWSYDIVTMVGNYGDVYEKHVGENTPVGLARAGSPNASYKNGGVLYAPPAR